MRGKVFLNQRVVLTGLATISFFIGGPGTVAIGLLIGPMMHDLGWAGSWASSAATAFIVAALIAGPLAGRVIDKAGARPIMVLGVLLYSSGFLLVSHCHSHLQMLTAFALVGVGYCASFTVPSAVIVADWMGEKKSLGMGIIWGAASAGAAIFSVLIGRWIESDGWRTTTEMLALLGGTMLPIIFWAVHSGPGRSAVTADAVQRPVVMGASAHVAKSLLISRVFVVTTASSTLFAIGMMAIYYHVVSVITHTGFETQVAGTVFGMSWIASAAGSLLSGAVADRLGAKSTLATAQLVCALGTLCLLGVTRSGIGLAYLAGFVVLWGASANAVNQLVPVIFAERLGAENLGTLVGVQTSTMGLISAGIPIMTGAVYDRFNDYRLAICLSAAATFLAFLVALLIDRQKSTGHAKDAYEPSIDGSTFRGR